MRLASLIRSEPFRAASRVLAAFLILYSIAGWALIKSVETTLLDELRSRIQGETELLSQIYRDEGRRGLIEAIERLGSVGPDRAYGLFDDGRLSLTGPISTQPDFLGFDTRELNLLSGGQVAGRYVLWVDRIDALTLVVGRDDALVETGLQRLLNGLIIFGTLLAITTLSLGLWAARRSQQRLDGMEHVLNEVAQGHLAARLDIGPKNDQFDRVAQRMNANLAQLERLVANVKSTASAIAHDLKTPLSHAQLAMHEAAEAVGNETKARDKVGAALAATDNLNRLFETILRISRIQATTDRSHFGPTQLNDAAQATATFFEPMAEENAQTLRVKGEDCTVHADADMIQQAVVNLVQNACVHAGHGAEIEIAVSSQDGRPFIRVKDTGPGIPDQTLKTVREPFTRASVDRGTPGHGLGLALVNAVAELHHAELRLENTPTGFEASLWFPGEIAP